ncbi:uncharacterized protein SPSK_00066 [Sporothrix schenckii 1099-18]|uniref:Aldehyde dehydrogenase domain-containing protein n=2 Tax=Sporothrix schenckii TaxID=29908 RepID=U7PMP4_SPOS1|nr:uncharacterized protein SPSK_00066 [Sporothrix schenckii 1099-18]ERS96857.1 hypothetical protein HMPREF1624_07066 [Sporothrix schenckii ATCC 58251]KJR79844.1 hypothetical protein SPSK_00066 [Sporothrix schenckii 1099-18]
MSHQQGLTANGYVTSLFNAHSSYTVNTLRTSPLHIQILIRTPHSVLSPSHRAHTKSFAPRVGLFEVDTEEEVIALANYTEYVHDKTILPQGGMKSSGVGRFDTNLSKWVQTKSITYRV